MGLLEAHLFGSFHRRTTAGFVVALLVLVASASGTHHVEAAGGLRVSAQGDCLRLRAAPGFAGAVIGCIPDGSNLISAGQDASADGLGWTLVRWEEIVGWVASQYLIAEIATPVPTATPAPSAPAVVATRVSAPVALREPPAGGLTVGLVGLVSPRVVAAGQPFEVASLAVYDAAAGRFVTYIPGSPVNTIEDDPLPAGTAVFIRRRGDLPATLPGPVATPSTATGTPSVLVAPAPGGTAVGVAGTGDLATLIASQPFAAESVSTWDTTSQRWLSHFVGAPDFANTLKNGLLGAESVVFVKRSAAVSTVVAAAPAPKPAAVAPAGPVASSGLNTISYGPAAISFYYCTPGIRNGSAGDGGGFCDYMANGERVHAGAASCAASYMGQRFLIAGDPLNRVYTCKDTGGAVTAGHRDIWFADSDEGGDWWRVVGMTAEIRVIVP
ncbi:MAG: hypothetical protein FJ037_04880 [Chloroflexi bacterium]|nr:hypothetical protein [Chloroflexota bacterium]